MKILFLSVQSSRARWFDELQAIYTKKLNAFAEFENRMLKSSGRPSDQASIKIKAEDKKLLQQLDATDFVVIFDERGASRDSMSFAQDLQKYRESGKSRIVFVVGGAYGLGAEMKARANVSISLSSLTMNHLVAQTVALEQIYRAFSILQGHPYHHQ